MLFLLKKIAPNSKWGEPDGYISKIIMESSQIKKGILNGVPNPYLKWKPGLSKLKREENPGLKPLKNYLLNG